MRTIWNAISFLALVHLLAMIMFAGWLWQSGRLNVDRLDRLRAMLAPTLAEEEAALEQQATEAAIDEAKAFEDARRQNPQPPSIDKVNYLARLEQSERDRARRIEQELTDLRLQLALAQQTLESQRAAFEQERDAWETERLAFTQQQGDEQFKSVVKMLESIPSKQAKDVLVTLVDDGKRADAVSYLNAMKPFNASKVLREFKSDEEKRMATELLQRVKVLGVQPPKETDTSGAAEAGISPDADAPASD